MPRFDGTGPEGKGELTGRGLGASKDGVCEGKSAGVSVNQGFYGRGRQMNNAVEVTTVQRGRGMGPCGLGLRRGMGRGLSENSNRGFGRGNGCGQARGMKIGRRGLVAGGGRGLGRGRGLNSF